jgi:hypothetical protein
MYYLVHTLHFDSVKFVEACVKLEKRQLYQSGWKIKKIILTVSKKQLWLFPIISNCFNYFQLFPTVFNFFLTVLTISGQAKPKEIDKENESS